MDDKTIDKLNMTQRDFKEFQTRQIEAWSQSLASECSLLPHTLSAFQASYSGATPKAEELFGMIKQLHDLIVTAKYDTFSASMEIQTL